MRKLLYIILIAAGVAFIVNIKGNKGVQHPAYEDEGCSQETADYYNFVMNRINTAHEAITTNK